MKISNKIVIAALAFGSFTTNAVAQLYAGAHAGYSFSTAPSVLGTADMQNGSTATTGNIYGSNGAGTSFGINLGYMVSEHFGIDLAADYLMVSPQKVNTNDASNTNLGVTQTNVASQTVSGSQIRLTPSLVVTAGKEGFNPYARFGVVLPVAGTTVSDISNVTSYSSPISKTYTTTAKVETAGQMSVGFNSAIGANFAISSKLSLFGELALTTLSIKAATSKVTAYSSEGATSTTTLSDLKTYGKETIYVDKLTETSNNSDVNSNYNVDKAKEELAPVANYNTLGINVGVKFTF